MCSAAIIAIMRQRCPSKNGTMQEALSGAHFVSVPPPLSVVIPCAG